MTGRLFSARFWGLASDRYGRRFVIVIALVSTVVLSFAFGFATSFTLAYTFRWSGYFEPRSSLPCVVTRWRVY